MSIVAEAIINNPITAVNSFAIGDIVTIDSYKPYSGTVIEVNADGTYNIEIIGEIPPIKKNIDASRVEKSTRIPGKVKELPPNRCISCITNCFSCLGNCCVCKDGDLLCCDSSSGPVCSCKCKCCV